MSLTMIDTMKCNYFTFDSLKIWNNCLVTNYKAISKDVSSGETFETFEVIVTDSEIASDLNLLYKYILCIHLCRQYYEITQRDIIPTLAKIIDNKSKNVLLRENYIKSFISFVKRGIILKSSLLEFGENIPTIDLRKYLEEFTGKVVDNYLI